MSEDDRKIDQHTPGGSKVEPSRPDLAAAELPEEDLAKVSGGRQKPDGSGGGNVAAKWAIAQGAVA